MTLKVWVNKIILKYFITMSIKLIEIELDYFISYWNKFWKKIFN